jgi:hypothetical protein
MNKKQVTITILLMVSSFVIGYYAGSVTHPVAIDFTKLNHSYDKHTLDAPITKKANITTNNTKKLNNTSLNKTIQNTTKNSTKEEIKTNET